MIWVIGLKTLNSKWVSLKLAPQFKYIRTFDNPNEAIKLIEQHDVMVERYINDPPAIRVLKIKYIKENIREQDIVEEYKNETELINIRNKFNKKKEVKDDK